MEITDFQNQWNNLNKAMAETTELNSNVLRRIIRDKSSKKITWLKIDSYRKSIAALIVFILSVSYFPIKGGFFSILGLLMLISLAIWVIYTEIRMVFLLSKVNFADSVLDIKKKLLSLKRRNFLNTWIAYSISPLSLLAILLMIHNDFSDLTLPKVPAEDFVFIIPIIIGFLVSIFIAVRIGIKHRYNLLDKEMNDLDLLEGREKNLR